MVHRKEMHMTESFGERIKRLRIRKNLNQNQVAIALQVTGKAISNYENNLRQPSLETLVRMANLYRVSIDYLLGQDHSESINTEGLTEKEVTLFKELISEVAEKNRIIRLHKYKEGIERTQYGEKHGH